MFVHAIFIPPAELKALFHFSEVLPKYALHGQLPRTVQKARFEQLARRARYLYEIDLPYN